MSDAAAALREKQAGPVGRGIEVYGRARGSDAWKCNTRGVRLKTNPEGDPLSHHGDHTDIRGGGA